MDDDQIIDVACIALPSGEAFWTDDPASVAPAIKAWRERHPDAANDGSCGGYVIVKMKRSAYRSIPATSASAQFFA